MNEGIQILVERVKTNPEDFSYAASIDAGSKWHNLLHEALSLDTITDEEKELLRAEVTKMSRARFTEKVMKALLVEDEPSDEGKPYLKPHHIMPLGGQTLAISNGTGSQMWGSTTINSLEEAMLRQQQASDTALKLKIFNEPEPEPKQTTLEKLLKLKERYFNEHNNNRL